MTAKTYILSLFAALPLAGMAQQSQELPSLAEKMVYRDAMYLQNLYTGSHNPTSFDLQPFTVTGVDLEWQHADGTLRPIDAGNWNGGAGNVFGVKKLGRTTFQGEFSYSNARHSDKRWNNTLLLSDDNPFIHADSMLSKFSTEFFHLAGGFSHRPNHCWRYGLNLDYLYGVTAAQKDPRTDTRAMRFKIEPGVEVMAKNLTFGLSGLVGFFAEDASYTVVEQGRLDDYYFRYKGMAYVETFNVYKMGFPVERRYSGNDYAGYFQFGAHGRAVSNFLELGMKKVKEGTEDGGANYSFDGGDFNSLKYSVSDRLMIRGERTVHNIALNASFKKGEGIWAVQTESVDPDTGGSLFTAEDRKVNHREWQRAANASYRIDVMKEEVPGFTAELTARYFSSDMRYLPEQYQQRYENLTGELALTKHFGIGRSLLSVTLRGVYNDNLDKHIELVSTFLDTYNRPRLEYLAAEYFGVGGDVSFQFPVRMFGQVNSLGVFARGMYNSYQGDVPYFDNRKFLTAGVSMVF